MNLELKAVVQARLKAVNMTQTQLATQLQITPALLGSALSGPLLRPEDHWPAVLEALGLEIVIRPKGS